MSYEKHPPPTDLPIIVANCRWMEGRKEGVAKAFSRLTPLRMTCPKNYASRKATLSILLPMRRQTESLFFECFPFCFFPPLSALIRLPAVSWTGLWNRHHRNGRRMGWIPCLPSTEGLSTNWCWLEVTVLRLIDCLIDCSPSWWNMIESTSIQPDTSLTHHFYPV